MPYFSTYIHRCRMVYTALYCFYKTWKKEVKNVEKEKKKKLIKIVSINFITDKLTVFPNFSDLALDFK